MNRKLQRKAEQLYRRIEEVVGYTIGEKKANGQSTGRQALVLFVTKKKPPVGGGAPKVLIPQTVGGISTDVIEIGEVKAQSFRGHYRPCPAGVSVGHEKVTAGTLGLWLVDNPTGRIVMVSNAHVLADTNNGRPGDRILQPGTYDGGRPGPGPDGDAVAFLSRSVKLKQESLLLRFLPFLRAWGLSAENFVDGAIAEPKDGIVNQAILTCSVYPRSVADAKPQVIAKKVGRTTENTAGECLYIGAALDVQYDQDVFRFHDLDLFGPMSQGGDSGSAMLSEDSQTLYGFLFAGSADITAAIPQRHFMAALNVRLP